MRPLAGPGRNREPNRELERELIRDVLASLSEKQSTWRAAEIVREAAPLIPAGDMTAVEAVDAAEQIRQTIEDGYLVDLTRPAPTGTRLRRDGRPITESALDRILTTPEILAQEERLVTLAERRAREGTDRGAVPRTEHLDPSQREAAEAVAGGRALVLVVGPTGAGKTATLRPAVDELRRSGRQVFGVAPSAAAAEVLADETGVAADTLDKLLIEHRLQRPPQPQYDLPAGTTVLVDEAGMVSTPQLAELFDLADRRRWRLALVGDPLQFAAVGRSGMFGHLVDTVGACELDRIHRFDAEWARRQPPSPTGRHVGR